MMRTRPLPIVRALGGVAVPLISLLLAGCGGSAPSGQSAAQKGSRPTSAEQVSFLRACGQGVGAGALGDAAVCQCTLTQLEAETNRRTFQAAVTAWKENAGGAGFRSTVAQVIARCQGQQQIAASPQTGAGTAVRSAPTVRTVKLSKAALAKHFAWTVSPKSMVHSCLDGTAVSNGMSCALAHAIDRAFGEYPDTKTPVVRHMRLANPDNGRVLSVSCAVSGARDASAVCKAPRHQSALLPPAGYDS